MKILTSAAYPSTVSESLMGSHSKWKAQQLKRRGLPNRGVSPGTESSPQQKTQHPAEDRTAQLPETRCQRSHR